jgi:hypothetical protein
VRNLCVRASDVLPIPVVMKLSTFAGRHMLLVSGAFRRFEYQSALLISEPGGHVARLHGPYLQPGSPLTSMRGVRPRIR